MSGTGGVAGLSLARAMMCSKVMSVCVQTSTTHTSCGVPPWLCATACAPLVGVRRRTWTTMGSRLMASTTASSCSTLEKSRPFTWGNKNKELLITRITLVLSVWCCSLSWKNVAWKFLMAVAMIELYHLWKEATTSPGRGVHTHYAFFPNLRISRDTDRHTCCFQNQPISHSHLGSTWCFFSTVSSWIASCYEFSRFFLRTSGSISD